MGAVGVDLGLVGGRVRVIEMLRRLHRHDAIGESGWGEEVFQSHG